jgi:vancomycin resistance protein YoaR
VNGSTGYEKELVIKAGGVTEADYGGGLCQVSTTTYRGVLNSGLPVTQRRNHSYYVKYYAPAGTDATIYPPYVDLMFENDTPGKVYIQTRVVPEKSKAYVYFWGTHDGRVVDVSPVSQRFDEVSNGNRVYEDVDWLEPGQVRMKDHGEAKDGFWTVQTSEVTYPDGTVRKDDFKSNYRAFPAFYYRGKQREVAVVSDVVSGE